MKHITYLYYQGTKFFIDRKRDKLKSAAHKRDLELPIVAYTLIYRLII